MDTEHVPVIPQDVLAQTKEIFGMPCCTQRVCSDGALKLGFGDCMKKLIRGREILSGRWNLVTYTCAWRVVRDGRVVCGSQDLDNSPEQLQRTLSQIHQIPFVSMCHLSSLDVRIQLAMNVSVDILCTMSDDDDALQFFLPNHLVATFSQKCKWRLGASDRPWPETVN